MEKVKVIAFKGRHFMVSPRLNGAIIEVSSTGEPTLGCELTDGQKRYLRATASMLSWHQVTPRSQRPW